MGVSKLRNLWTDRQNWHGWLRRRYHPHAKMQNDPPPAKSSDKEMSANTFVLLIFTARCYASAVPAMGLCPSVTSRRSIETAERIELVFGTWASFHPSYTMLKGNLVIFKNKGTSVWNLVLNSWLWKFRHGISIVETCHQLSSRKVDAQSMINWAVVGQLSR